MATRFVSFERQIKVATAGLEPAAIAVKLAAVARRALAEAIRSGEAPSTYERVVNGRVGAPEDSVVPPGPIVYRFNWLGPVAVYALEFLRARSPVRAGRYRESHFVMANGRKTAPESIPPGAELIVTNDRPYARKIQVGAMKMSVPPGIYEDARQAVQRRFGRIVRVDLRFVSLAGAYRLRRGRKRGQPITYPALVVNAKN